MSEQDERKITVSRLRDFKELYDTKVITPINDKIDGKTNALNGEIITTNNETNGYFKNITVSGNSRYKKSDGTYTDTWEDGVSLESVGEKEKNSNGKYPIEVVSCGKNLFSTELFEKISLNKNCNLCSWNEDTGVLHLSWNGVKTYLTLLTSQKIKKNTQYTLSFEIQGKQSWLPNTIRIEYTDGTESQSQTTLDSTTEYKKIILISDVNKTISRIYWVGVTISNVKNLQLEEGTIATTYEPYKESKRNILLDNPLRKVGEVADVLDLEKMKVTRKIKSITIDGTITNWVQAKIGDNSILWYIILSDAIPNTPSMCDKLKNDDTLWEHDISRAYRIDENKAFQIRTDKTISNLSAITTWLQSNPVTLVYQLATPITEDIDVSSNTLTDFATSCTLTIDNTIKGNIECNEVVGLIPSVEEDRTRLTNLETDNTTNKSNITNLQQENQTLKNNVKALEYVVNNSNRLNYNGEVIANSNSAVGDIRNIIVNGNTRYKKSDGTYTDTWESGVSLESVGEKEKNADGKYPIEVVSIDNAKNLIKSDNILDGYYYDNNNTLQPNSSFQTLKKAISVQSNKTYYVVNSSNTKTNVTYVLYYATDGSVIKCEYDKNIITIPSNCTSIRFSTGGLKNLCFSLSENYSVYTFDKRTILLENPLRKNGSISDFADLEKKEVTRNCGVKILDGSETWGKESLTRTNTSLFYLSLTSSIFAKAGKCLSDKLSYNYNIYSTDEEGIRIDANGNLQISILKSKLATDNVTGFKTWLVSNNVTVVYQLATPTTEDIEVSLTDNPLTSYTPSTTLTTNNNIKGNISADMPTNVNAIIVNQASEIAKLQDSLLETQSALIETQYNSLT